MKHFMALRFPSLISLSRKALKSNVMIRFKKKKNLHHLERREFDMEPVYPQVKLGRCKSSYYMEPNSSDSEWYKAEKEAICNT